MTQAPVGMFEYSVFPMKAPKKEDLFYGNYPGRYVTEYLNDFAMSKTFGGRTIKDRIEFQSGAERIIKGNRVWIIEAENGKTFKCTKLIMAIGLTSTPFMPAFTNQLFTPPIIHSKYLAQADSPLNLPEIKNVVIIGGAKSALDAVQILTRAGKSVSWIIRTTGEGPPILSPPDAPLHNSSHEILSKRGVIKTLPCIWDPEDGWSRFFHQSATGRWLAAFLWTCVNAIWQQPPNYGRNANFRLLTPDRPAFWAGDTIAVCNSADLWDTVSKATVYRDNVEKLEDKRVVLVSGKQIECDALVVCTGWKSTYSMFDAGLTKELGLPVPVEDVDREESQKWEGLIKKADKKVLEMFPVLATAPAYPTKVTTTTPNRFYRSMLPANLDPEDQSIIFLGALGTTQSLTVAEIQSLWAAAYLSGNLKVPKKEEKEVEVAETTAWRRRRYLADGSSYIYDQIPVCFEYPML
jgi:dimethylaniline monooxygenase (N-oxide forming)